MRSTPKKVSALLNRISIFVTANIVLVLLTIVAPNVAFILSSVLICILFIMFCVGRWFGAKLETWIEGMQNSENIEVESDNVENNELAIVAFIIFILIIIAYLIIWDWLKRALRLSLFPFLISLTVAHINFLGENKEMFLCVVAIYIFLRLCVNYSLDQIKESNKAENNILLLKVIAESWRFVFIAIAVLNRDGFEAIQIHPSVIDGIIATLILDSMINGIKRFLPPKIIHNGDVKS